MNQDVSSLQAQLHLAQQDLQRLRLDLHRHQQREQWLRDLHDDVGALLLSLIYRVDSLPLVTQARSTLLDLRDLSRRSQWSPVPVSDALADWRNELALQVESLHGRWHWQVLGQLPEGCWSVDTVTRWGRVVRQLIARLICTPMEQLTVQVSYADDHLMLVLTRWPGGDGQQRRALEHSVLALCRRSRLSAGELRWCDQLQGVRCRIPLTI